MVGIGRNPIDIGQAMKQASTAAIAIISTGSYAKAELWEFDVQIPQPITLRFCNWDVPLIVDGNVYDTGLIFERDTIKQSIGLNADTLDVTLGYHSDALTRVSYAGIPFIAAAQRGYLDSCQVRMSKVFMAKPGDTSAGLVPWFWGRVANVEGSRMGAKITIESNVAMLNIQMPRNLYQTGCSHSLFDAGCTVSRAAYTFYGSVSNATTTINAFTSSGLAQADGYFALGTLTWTSGQNAGLSRGIKSQIGGVITMSSAVPTPPSAGDAFTIYPGCDKQQATCSSTKFANNILHFRGYPYIPVPETLYDGGSFNPQVVSDGQTGKSTVGSGSNAAKLPGSYVA